MLGAKGQEGVRCGPQGLKLSSQVSQGSSWLDAEKEFCVCVGGGKRRTLGASSESGVLEAAPLGHSACCPRDPGEPTPSPPPPPRRVVPRGGGSRSESERHLQNALRSLRACCRLPGPACPVAGPAGGRAGRWCGGRHRTLPSGFVSWSSDQINTGPTKERGNPHPTLYPRGSVRPGGPVRAGQRPEVGGGAGRGLPRAGRQPGCRTNGCRAAGVCRAVPDRAARTGRG